MDLHVESYGGILASLLMNKIPQELQLMVSRKIRGDEWKLHGVMKVIEEEVRACESIVKVSTPIMKKPSREPPTAATLLTGQGTSPTCTYCQ